MAEATLIVRLLGKGGAALKRMLDSAASSLRNFGTAAKTAGGAALAGGKKAQQAGSLFGGFRSKLFDALLVTALVTGFVRSISRAVQAVVGLFQAAAKASIEFTSINITLKAATSSTDEFVTASLAASDIARRYGVELLTVSKGLADFLAATQTSTLAFVEQIAIFESLVRAGRVLNLSNERIRLSILAIGQIASKGSLQMEELKRQLESIPGAVPRLAKALGITVPELFKQTSEGAIGASRALRGLRIVFNEIAAEQIVSSMQALAAALGRAKIEAELVKIAFGDAADEGIREVVEAVGELLERLQPLASALGELASKSILPATARLAEVAGNFASVVGLGLQKIVDDAEDGAFALGILSDKGRAVIRDLERLGEQAKQVELFLLVEEFRELEKAILSGDQALTAAFKDSAKGREEAAAQLAKITKALIDGTIGEVEALRLKKSILVTISEQQQRDFELLQIQDRERQAETQRSIDQTIKQRQAMEELGEFEKALARDRLKAIGEAVLAAENLARDRIAESRRTRDEILPVEQELLDKRLEIFNKALEGVEISGGKRREIEEALSNELLDIEQKFQEKRQKLIDDANEAIKEDGSKRTEILEKLTEDLAKLLEKQGQDVDKLIKKRIDGAKKAADKEIKEAERSAKKQQQILKGLEKSFSDLASKRESLFGDDAGEISGPSVGGVDTGSLAAAKQELADIQAKTIISAEDINRETELLILIAKLEQGLGAAAAAAGGLGQDLVGSSQKALEVLRDLTVGSSDFQKAFAQAGPSVQQNIREILVDLEEMAAAGNLNRDVFDQALNSIDQNLQTAGFSVKGLSGGLFDLGENVVSLVDQLEAAAPALPKMGEGASEAAAGVSKVADQLEAAGAAIRIIEGTAEGAKTKITNLGEEAEAAGGGIQILTDEEDEASVAADQLAESAGRAAEKEQELADAAESAAENVTIPQEAIDSITRLQEVLGSLELDPLLVPLETLASTMKSLSESVPLLPEPLQAVAASLLELVENEILGPLAEGFEKVNVEVGTLAEKLPVVAEAQVAFNEAAAESEESLGTLEAGLKKVAEEELLGRLEKLAEALGAIHAAAVKLTEASDAADAFVDAMAELDRELKSFAVFIEGPFADALAQHAAGWQAPIDKTREYGELLDEMVNDKFPALTDAGSSAFDVLDTRADQFAARLREISSLIDEIITKNQSLG